MKYFPFFLQLNKLPCLVVGGGSVAERKLDLLIKANANITIISPDFSDYILELSKNYDIKCITDEYSEHFLEGNKYVVRLYRLRNLQELRSLYQHQSV